MGDATQNAYFKSGVSVAVDGGTGADVDVRGLTGLTFIGKLTALTGGTTPSVQFAIDYKLPDGTYIQAAIVAAPLTVISTTPSTGISFIHMGPGLATAQVSGVVIRPRWVVVGAPTTAVADMFILGEADY